MKKLVCLLLALMLCVCAACAETVTIGGLALNIPAQWRVNKNIQTENEHYLELAYLTDTPVHAINMTHTQLANWDEIAAAEDGLMHFANLSAITLLAKLGDADVQVQTERHIALRDGGHALKIAYKRADGITNGLLIILSGGAMVTVLTANEDGAQCEAWLDQMLLPMRVQENMKAGSVYISIPAGFVKNDENGLYFNENNEAIKVFTMDASGEEMQKLLAEGPAGLLLLVLKSQIGDLQYSNLQVDTLELEGSSALISSMDVTANGNSGCMGALTALYDDMVVGVSYLGNQGGQQAAADLMQVITYQLQEHRGFYMGDVTLAYPEGFDMAEYEKQEDAISATLSDQLLPEITVISTPLTEEEKQMEARSLLITKLQEELSSVTGSEFKKIEEEYDDATAIYFTWYDEWSGVQYANGLAFAVTEENLIRIYSEWPNGDTEYARSVLEEMLPSPALGETIAQGNVTVCIPAGMQVQKTTQEDGAVIYSASSSTAEIAVDCYPAPPEALHGMAESMGMQTAMEILLSMEMNENGVEGLTIEYTACENGVHLVETVFEHQQLRHGIALMLDGEAWWQVFVMTNETEEGTREIMNELLQKMR